MRLPWAGFEDSRDVGVILNSMLFESQQLSNIQHVVDTVLNGRIPPHLGDRHGSEEVQDIPSGEVAMVAVIQQKTVGKRLAEVVYADAINGWCIRWCLPQCCRFGASR